MIGNGYPLADDEERSPSRGRSVTIVFPRATGVRRGLVLAAGLIDAFGVVAAVLAAGTGYDFQEASGTLQAAPLDVPKDPAAVRKLQARLLAQNKQLSASLAKLAPTGTYIVVDQTQNRLYLMNGTTITRTAVCSAGSGMVLSDWGGKRKWVFDTPRGMFKVRTKISDPIWRKPDWEFVSEGKPLPTNPADRFESGTLGKYALYLEDGYMIHGTLYTRLLGRSVTHGCIRLGPEDLQAVWDGAPVGTPVYIF